MLLNAGVRVYDGNPGDRTRPGGVFRALLLHADLLRRHASHHPVLAPRHRRRRYVRHCSGKDACPGITRSSVTRRWNKK